MMRMERHTPSLAERQRVRRPKLVAAIGVLVALCGPALTQAESTRDIEALLNAVRADAAQERSHIREREQRFKESRDEQEALKREVDQRISALEAMRASLKTRFDENELRLAELTAELTRRTGDLGELFGVFRQTADDTQTLLFDSLITLERPARLEEVERLAAQEQVPTIGEMRELWALLLEEIALSGSTQTFKRQIVAPDGQSYEADVTRVGLFNAVTGDKYLNYLPETGSVIELPRQPDSGVRDTANRLTSAAPEDVVGFALDPSRGALLGLLIQSPSLWERVQQGRQVGYAIIILALIGMAIVVARWFSLWRLGRLMREQLKNLDRVSDDNPLGRIMLVYYENEHLDDQEVIARKLEQTVMKDVTEVRRGLSTIKVLAAVAPLMGLLGTVTGMIGTFQAITLFGVGDPKLMAGGISQALVTTVLGLVAAIPLLLSFSLLSSNATSLTKLIGEQAAGLMAQKAETIAKGKQQTRNTGS
ncbi:MAG: MotA/TolQ/ExbB proton channel family protein [Pseudomonadales bacterium]